MTDTLVYNYVNLIKKKVTRVELPSKWFFTYTSNFREIIKGKDEMATILRLVEDAFFVKIILQIEPAVGTFHLSQLTSKDIIYSLFLSLTFLFLSSFQFSCLKLQAFSLSLCLSKFFFISFNFSGCRYMPVFLSVSVFFLSTNLSILLSSSLLPRREKPESSYM